MMPTTVVNLTNDQYDVYIGREGHGRDGYFGNPYRMSSEADRALSLDKYRVYFYNRLKTDPEFHSRVMQLQGKILGCFCKPKDCHGDIIVEFLANFHLPWILL